MLLNVISTIRTEAWRVVALCVVAIVVVEVSSLNGPNVCMVKQKYNITKRVKYRAPMSVRIYEWCFSMPPRCSKWNTEMRDLTRLETEERTAEVAVCCPGYKMRDVSCVPICPNGKTGPRCSEDCPDNKWGPNCIHECKRCKNGFCSPITGECECLDGWQGESCDASMPPTTTAVSLEELLTTLTTKITTSNTTPKISTSTAVTSAKPKLVISTTPTPTILVTIPTIAMTPKIATDLSNPIPTVKPSTIYVTSPINTTISATTKPYSTLQMSNNEKILEVTTPSVTTTEIHKSSIILNNTTFAITNTPRSKSATEEVTRRITVKPAYNTTEAAKVTDPNIVIKILKGSNAQQEQNEVINETETPNTTITSTSIKEMSTTEATKKETTVKMIPTTSKFKPKEIWIKPAQKGDSPILETKIKMTHEVPRYRSANNKELTPTSTTTKTIIVSIIPTSVSYSTFKKIALTSSYLSTKNTTNIPTYSKTDYGSATQPMLAVTVKPPIALTTLAKEDNMHLTINDTAILSSTSVPSTSVPSTSVPTKATTTSSVTKSLEVTKTIPHINRTNSMMTEINNSTSISVIATSPKIIHTTLNQNVLLKFSTTKSFKISTTIQPVTEPITKHFEKSTTFEKNENVPSVIKSYKTTNLPKVVEKEITKSNVTNSLSKVTTESPEDDEEFHILTEPEHITAVMGDKSTERSSVDLISVISIAGGVMMAVITVAVIIVMIERCKKPRYEEVRKINDIRMQVMIDNNDAPPPYVRSIFHTPLPEPPASEKCHYQPISTLDRNLKQFMRPVVVQTLSPIMLENFRGILECHYDHLPRRSDDFGTIQMRSSIAPSIMDCNELHQLRASVTESAIEALKCEAKLDVIDTTTSEPLYAEIPCWRPPSEHAIEIINLNGEAVTEL